MTQVGNPLILLGDKVVPCKHLRAFVTNLRHENQSLPAEQQVMYAVCADSSEVAVTMRNHIDDVKMVLVGPGLRGNGVTIARMLASKARVVMVVDPRVNPLGEDPAEYARVQLNLEELEVVIVQAHEADEGFFEPLIKQHVLSGMDAGATLESMSPDERAAAMDKRLDAVSKFPSLPETQRKMAQLDDLDPPKRWAEAIDPDIPTRTVILKILNSARYGFRSRVETIDQAVALASAKTIREIVTACQVQQIFSKTEASNLDQFWRHSLATAYFAKLFGLPADANLQSSQQKTEFERYQLDDEHVQALVEAKIWDKMPPADGDEPFTAGLLHDIGKVAMLMCLEDSQELVMAVIESEFQAAAAEDKLWAGSTLAVEQMLMKHVDHQVVGGRLAESWELDESMQQVLRRHHSVNDQSPPQLKLVALADVAANCLFPYPSAAEVHPFPILMGRIDAELKKSSKTGFDATAEVVGGEILEDLVDVLARMEVPETLWSAVDFKTFFTLVHMLAPKIRSATIGFLQQTGG